MIDEVTCTTAPRHCDVYVHRVREVHCDTPWFFPARRIVLPSERRKIIDTNPMIDDGMIRRIPADIDFTANGAADMGGVTRHPLLPLRLRGLLLAQVWAEFG